MSTVKERPILMCDKMVRAILDGRKHQTRRAVNPQPIFSAASGDSFEWHGGEALVKAGYGAPYVHLNWAAVERAMLKVSPYVVGQQLWVKECWATSILCDDRPPSDMEKPGRGYGWPVWYAADGAINLRGRKSLEGGVGFTAMGKTRPSIFMPRWASRLTLEITNVRVERLQDIGEDDAKAEGIEGRWHPDDPHLWTWRDYGTPGRFAYGSMFGPVESYQTLWNSINGKGAWDKNPYVWVICFKRL